MANSQVIDLGFRARPWQFEALSALKRFSVLIVHRGGGKTLAAVMKLIDSGLRTLAGSFAYIAPELKQAKTAAWGYLTHYARKIPGTSVNESELWVQLPNKTRIRIFGADDPDSLRGQHLDGLVLDEVAQMKPDAWGEVLLPALGAKAGWCLFIGTPKGINLLSDTYFRAEADPEWFAKRYPINVTKAIPESELEVIRGNQTDRQWRQEYLCDFDASSDETLISIDLVRQALGRHLPDEAFNSEPKVMGVDVALGGGDLTAIQTRQGLVAFPPNVVNLSNPHEIADLVAYTIDVFQPDAVFIDDSGGYGSGVISRLEGLRYVVTGVKFGWAAINERYVNRSTEMWWAMKQWLEKGGALPPDQRYLVQLTGRRCDYKNSRGKMAIETKDQMKARGIKSPDIADALALTFAAPVAVTNRMIRGLPAQIAHIYRGTLSGDYNAAAVGQISQHVNGTSYDPFQRYAEEAKREFG